MTDPVPGETLNSTSYSAKSLIKEVTLVFFVQLVIVAGLVQIDSVYSFGGMLHTLVAVVFILLPVLVLDRRGKPYRRLGVGFKNPGKDILWTAIAMAVFFPFVVFATHVGFAVLGPWIWGLKSVGTWEFAWPRGYPALALSHILVVALPEEFFYRGYLMGRLDEIFTGRINLLGAKVGWSLVISSVAFGFGHVLVDFNPYRFMVFFSALAFGWLKARTGSIVAPILFHAASNIFMEIFRAGYGLR